MKQLALCAVLASATIGSSASLVSYYDFNNNLNPVVNVGGQAGALQFRTGNSSGTSTVTGPNFSSATVGSTTKQVAQFDAPQFFRANHGIGKNGGGNYVNLYSILMDVRIGGSGWTSLYNTNENALNDGDGFVDPNNQLGIAGDYAGSFTRNAWQRLVITVNSTAPGPTISFYLDGVHQNSVALDGVDGRWSMYTYNDPDSFDHVDIFSDNDGDNGSGHISALAFYDGALTASEVSALGAAGQPVPEPATLATLGLGMLTLRRRRNR